MKIAIIFPGIGYTADKPLLHYGRRLAADLGYEVRVMSYKGFPSKVKGDRKRMEESISIALEQSREMLSGTNLADYDDVLFIGKSIGTIVAAKIASESAEKTQRIVGEIASEGAKNIRLILYTPLEETFAFPFGRAVAFTGTADPWVGGEESRIFGLCAERGIPCFRIPGGNHSLESGDVLADIGELYKVMEETRRFIREEVQE